MVASSRSGRTARPNLGPNPGTSHRPRLGSLERLPSLRAALRPIAVLLVFAGLYAELVARMTVPSAPVPWEVDRSEVVAGINEHFGPVDPLSVEGVVPLHERFADLVVSLFTWEPIVALLLACGGLSVLLEVRSRDTLDGSIPEQ